MTSRRRCCRETRRAGRAGRATRLVANIYFISRNFEVRDLANPAAARRPAPRASSPPTPIHTPSACAPLAIWTARPRSTRSSRGSSPSRTRETSRRRTRRRRHRARTATARSTCARWRIARAPRTTRSARSWSPRRRRRRSRGGPLAIPRVRCETLSLARFRRDFVIPQRPVIIVGLGPHLTSDGANASDLRWLRKHGASKKVAVSVDNAHVASTLSCGGVEIVNLGDHLDVVSALDEDPPVNERDARFGKRRGDGSYLYDCAIPLKLPSLSHGVRVPRYFAHDFLQRTRMTHAFSASWPSLFVAAPHTRSSLHVDQWKGNFWMAMVKGTKRWTLFHREDIPFLSPDYGRGTLDPGFPSLVELDASRVSAANAATTTTRRGDGIGDSQKLDADAAASSARETETTHETPASHPFLEYARRWDCDPRTRRSVIRPRRVAAPRPQPMRHGVVRGELRGRGAFYTLVPIRPRSRGERRSLRTLPGVSLRPPLAFNPRPRCLSTPTDAFQLHPDFACMERPSEQSRRRALRHETSREQVRAADDGDARRARRGVVRSGG